MMLNNDPKEEILLSTPHTHLRYIFFCIPFYIQALLVNKEEFKEYNFRVFKGFIKFSKKPAFSRTEVRFYTWTLTSLVAYGDVNLQYHDDIS